MKYGNCTTSNVKVSGTLAVATVTTSLEMTFKGNTMSLSTPTLVSLVLENNQWKIDFTNLGQSFPNLSGDSFLNTPTPTSN